jgi:hypothetical protein
MNSERSVVAGRFVGCFADNLQRAWNVDGNQNDSTEDRSDKLHITVKYGSDLIRRKADMNTQPRAPQVGRAIFCRRN